ncbi:MAG TPA: quercetin 2,3-dioxygenase [Bryobacteraceae bacterium]|jgi:quercetin dioxygenase-like cupin family protein
MLNQSQSNQGRSNQDQAKHVPAGTGRAYCGPGDRITYLITGEETGGAFFMAEVSVAPGGGPPPHFHSREDESFYLQQGTLTVQVGDKALNVSPGDFVHMPRGVMHSFKNVGEETAKLLMVASPAGLENYFAETFFPAADAADIPQLGPAVIARAMKTAPKYGLELLVPAGIRD